MRPLEQVLKDLGDRIQEVRQSQDLSLHQLSNDTDIPLETLYQIELGVEDSDIVHLARIANRLNVYMSELFSPTPYSKS